MKKNTLLILSGGMDSTTALYEFRDSIALAVTFNYGSKHNHEEGKRASINCDVLGIPHRVVNLDFAAMGFVSNLLQDGGDIPEGWYDQDNMAATVVPFRNGIMLSLAAGIADSLNLKKVMLASHAGDHAQYPDCRPEFNTPMAEAIFAGTKNGIDLIAPYANISKRSIALRGERLTVPWELTYSCYNGGPVHCGKCGTCTERLEALEGLSDNTEYLDKEYWKQARDEANAKRS